MLACYRLLLRAQLTRGRIAGLGAVAVIVLLMAVAASTEPSVDRVRDAGEFVDTVALGLLVPVVSLVFAAASLGDPAEDRTLVYVWLRPLARWRIATAATAASLSVAIPFAVLPVLGAAAIGSRVDAELLVATTSAALLAAVAYVSLFTALGLVVRRALAWGLAYVLIWEGFVARAGRGPARLSVVVYARSALAHLADLELPASSASLAVSVAVPIAVAAAGVAATTYALRRVNVD